MFTSLAPKRTNYRHGSGSTVAAAWCRLTMEEAETGLVADDLLAVGQWWLEERWLVLACRLVKAAAVCQSVGSLSQTEDF